MLEVDYGPDPEEMFIISDCYYNYKGFHLKFLNDEVEVVPAVVGEEP